MPPCGWKCSPRATGCRTPKLLWERGGPIKTIGAFNSHHIFDQVLTGAVSQIATKALLPSAHSNSIWRKVGEKFATGRVAMTKCA